MDNEEIMQQAEVTDTDLSAFDEDWDEGAAAAEETAEDEADGEGDTQPDENAEAETGDTGDESAETNGDGDATEGDKPAADGDKFTVKHMGDEKQLGLEEMLSLASKGMDYDGLRSDRDKLRADNASLKTYESFLKEVAAKSGVGTIEEQMLRTRAQWIKAEEHRKGNEISEADAIFRAQKQAAAAGKGANAAADSSAQSQNDSAGQNDAAGQKDGADDRHGMFQAFVEEYPDVKAADIPQSVWTDCAKSGDLLGAYRKYEIGKLKEDIKTLSQNNKNKERSTGSRRTAGAATPKDAFDDAWDSD